MQNVNRPWARPDVARLDVARLDVARLDVARPSVVLGFMGSLLITGAVACGGGQSAKKPTAEKERSVIVLKDKDGHRAVLKASGIVLSGPKGKAQIGADGLIFRGADGKQSITLQLANSAEGVRLKLVDDRTKTSAIIALNRGQQAHMVLRQRGAAVAALTLGGKENPKVVLIKGHKHRSFELVPRAEGARVAPPAASGGNRSGGNRSGGNRSGRENGVPSAMRAGDGARIGAQPRPTTRPATGRGRALGAGGSRR